MAKSLLLPISGALQVGLCRFDLMRHDPATSNGVMDFLFCSWWGRAQGFRKFTLGIAPLAGLRDHPLAPSWHKAGNLLFRYGEELFGLAGLRAYKQKFRPTWQPRYLAAPGGLALPSLILDLVLLISPPFPAQPQSGHTLSRARGGTPACLVSKPAAESKARR
jgi:lysylphosphatidylglycerol synthetase-like protein (DUF2156 family)